MIGASGWVGGAIAREALARGHDVTAIARHADRLTDLDGADLRVSDATDATSLASEGGSARAAARHTGDVRLDLPLSPPPVDFISGEKRGGYGVRRDDRPVTAEDGASTITSGDFAAAMLDELEAPQFSRRRFTAAYQP